MVAKTAYDFRGTSQLTMDRMEYIYRGEKNKVM